MKKLFAQTLDCTDYLLTNNVEPVANLVQGLSQLAKTASVHSIDEINGLDDENVALILFHTDLGEINKYACSTAGITEVNINLLASKINEIPEELLKVAGNNLGYVAEHYGISIPEELQVYQSHEWKNPRVDVQHINKVAFYQKVNANKPEVSCDTYALPLQEKFPIHDENHVKLAVAYFNEPTTRLNVDDEIMFCKNLVKQAENLNVDITSNIQDIASLDCTKLSDNFVDNVNARIKLSHDARAIELYEDILDKHAEYHPTQLAIVLHEADKYFQLDRAVSKGMIKHAAVATYSMEKLSWFEEKLANLDESKTPVYIGKEEYASLFTDEGEDIFNSLPKPTKDKLIQDMG